MLRAGIDNLFDEEYTIYPNGLNQPGRTFKLSGRRDLLTPASRKETCRCSWR